MVTDGAGAVAGAGAVGDAAVEGDTDDADVGFGQILSVGCAEECGDPGVAGLGLGVLQLGVMEGGFKGHGGGLAGFGGGGDYGFEGAGGLGGVQGEGEEGGQLSGVTCEAAQDAGEVWGAVWIEGVERGVG